MEIEVVLDQEIEVVLNGGNPGGALCGKFDTLPRFQSLR